MGIEGGQTFTMFIECSEAFLNQLASNTSKFSAPEWNETNPEADSVFSK